MRTHWLQGALALALSATFLPADATAAVAQRKRAAVKKPRPPVLIERPYSRDPGCIVTYDSAGFANPPELSPTCERAFRRLYPPR